MTLRVIPLLQAFFKCNPSNICAVFYQISTDSASRGPSATAGLLVIVRQMQEKFRVKGKKLYVWSFVDLEKAFDIVPREVIRWAMRKLGVEEWLTVADMSMYTGAKTVVRTVYRNSVCFEVKVGMHKAQHLVHCYLWLSWKPYSKNSGLPYHGSCCMLMIWLW